MKPLLISVSAIVLVAGGVTAVVLTSRGVPPVVVIPPGPVLTIATSSPPMVPGVATTSANAATPLVNVSKKASVTTTTVVTTTQTSPPASTGASITPPAATTTQPNTVGTTTLVVGRIPLLVGGAVHADETVSVSFLQITNVGEAGALLKGFWMKQNGSAPGESVIGLSTVDDKGGSRGLNGGVEGTVLFQNGLAFAPTNAYFAPGQMRLFTIKAIMAPSLSSYIGMELMIDVASIESAATVQGQFPIRGTTWTIVE